MKTEEQKAKKLAYTYAWRERNKEYLKQYEADRYIKMKDQKKEYRKTNKDAIAKRFARWADKNREKRRLYKHTRRARVLSNGGFLSVDIVSKLMKLQKGLCVSCKKSLRKERHLDHIVAIANGGTNTDQNVQLLCPKCNFEKHVKHPVDFMREKGFLL